MTVCPEQIPCGPYGPVLIVETCSRPTLLDGDAVGEREDM